MIKCGCGEEVIMTPPPAIENTNFCYGCRDDNLMGCRSIAPIGKDAEFSEIKICHPPRIASLDKFAWVVLERFKKDNAINASDKARNLTNGSPFDRFLLLFEEQSSTYMLLAGNKDVPDLPTRMTELKALEDARRTSIDPDENE